MDVRDDTSARNRGLDEGVELLVTANRELQVPRRDALHLEVLGGVPGELEDLGGEVLEDSGSVYRRGGADPAVGVHAELRRRVRAGDRSVRARGGGRVESGHELAQVRSSA